MREIKIESLSEFIFEIDKLGTSYFRGEAKDFGETKNTASGYRWLYESNKKFSELISLREKYYQEIGYSLSLKETENFIAYAQHHGLPTELLDVSENPLVSLFFACCENDDQDGFVYSLEKSKTFDLGKYLVTDDVSDQFFDFKKIVIEAILNSGDISDYTIDELLNEKQLLKYIEMNNPNLDNVNSYMDCLKNYNFWMDIENIDSDDYGGADIICSNHEAGLEISRAMVKYFIESSTSIDDLFNSTSKWSYCLTYMGHRNFSDRQYFKIALFEFAFYILDQQANHNFIPVNLMVHKPSVKFDRMINQQGNFIYQNHLYQNGDLLTQRYNTDCTFRVPSNRKQELLLQLDRIGINRKFIYPDHDNIAKYIKENIEQDTKTN